MRMTAIKVLILGTTRSANRVTVTVRFLTKRFIGEYYSCIDHVYRSSVRLEDTTTDVEVLDTCSKTALGSMEGGDTRWADAVVVVYSICNRQSFHTAKDLLHHFSHTRSRQYTPILLLGNKQDLDHRREVEREEGDELALGYGCQFNEVSAADSAESVDLAFLAFLRDVRSVQQRRAVLSKRRKSLGSVAKMLGAMFGKSSLGGSKDYGGECRKSMYNGTKNCPQDQGMAVPSGNQNVCRLSVPNADKGGKRDCPSERRWSISSTGSNEHSMSVSNVNKDGYRDCRVQRRVSMANSNRPKSCEPSMSLFKNSTEDFNERVMSLYTGT